MEFEDTDPAIGLLEVRQAYAMSNEDLAEEARVALDRVGGAPLEMRLTELCVVREWTRRRLERALGTEHADNLRAQFELLCDILYDRVPPLS